MNELVIIEDINPLTLFTGDGMDPILENIARQARDFEADVTTAKGRSKIVSQAYKVATSKTLLDGLGKKLKAEWQEKVDGVDRARRKIRKELEALSAEVRKPVTDWEAAEEARIERHKSAILSMDDTVHQMAREWDSLPLDHMRDRLTETEAIPMGTDPWDEFAGEAAEAKDKAITAIKWAVGKREEADDQAAELERLRQEKERRDGLDRDKAAALQQQEYEEEIRKDAAAAQKREDEEARQALIREKEEAEERAGQAERSRQADAELAATLEREKIKQEQHDKNDAARRREENDNHRRKVNVTAKKALMVAGLPEKLAKVAVKAIAQGLVPGCHISY